MAEQGVRWPLVSNKIRGGKLSNTFGAGVRTQTKKDPEKPGQNIKNPDGKTDKLFPKPHQGWDFYAANGTPCYAIHDGKVISTASDGDYGRRVVIELDTVKVDGGKVYAMYAHLSSYVVGIGEKVKKNDVIGYTGSTGNASNTDPHLHFELRNVAAPGKGISGRMSPMRLFKPLPLKNAVMDCSGLDDLWTFEDGKLVKKSQCSQ